MKIGDAQKKAYEKAVRSVVRTMDVSFTATERLGGLLEYIDEYSVEDIDLLLPVGKGQPAALVGCVAASAELSIVAPVCPPVLNFEGSYAPAVSPEAHAALRAAEELLGTFATKASLEVDVTILVADTEDDLPRVAQEIGVQRYMDVCRQSASYIETAAKVPLKAMTFSDYFSDFREQQYQTEEAVRRSLGSDEYLKQLVHSVSDQRAEKHRQILGRPEQDNELAIRYVAQYASFGRIMRQDNMPIDAVLNYQTPNLTYINHPLAGAGRVPVFESRRRTE